MSRQRPNRPLAALLAEAGWNAGELARAVNALGTTRSLALRYDRTSVAHWLAGSRPRAPVPALVAEVLSTRTGRLLLPEDTGLTRLPPGHAAPPGPWPGQGDPAAHLIDLTRGDSDPARRALFLQDGQPRSLYSPAVLALLEWPDRPPAEARPTRAGATAADAQTLQEMTRVFADLAEHHGGGHIRSALAAYLADDAGRVLTAEAPETVRRDLLTAGAQLTHLLGKMTADAGYPALAERYYRTAMGLAHAGGSRPTYAITLRAMSVQALRVRQFRPALQLAEVAVRTATPAAPPAALAFLLTQRAAAHAYQRHPHAALRDLDTAQEHHRGASGPPGPFSDYPRAGLDYQRGQTLLALGRLTDGLSALRDSALHRPAHQRRAAALTNAAIAETLLTLGHLEEACAHWHVFLDLYPHLTSLQADRALGRMLARLRPHQRHRQADSVRERGRLLSAERRRR
ncbi:hypothetical protein ACFO3J_18475 [Streptomyces polygonati]|uniref:Transcriptional regulator n=1 Tax=Streptomyces polygonati TaxID=1617087 RepID=A0ABV8HUB3_9ACTN